MKLTLQNDIEVSMRNIHQWSTNAGLMEGAPRRWMNTKIINALKRQAKQFCYAEDVYVIEPKEKVISTNKNNPMSEYAIVELPKITCMARFEYFRAFRDKEMDFSYMAIAWFQDEYAFPIDENILEKIKTIPWTEVAIEYQF